MVVFAFPVLPDFEDDGVEPLSHPADRALLCRKVRALVKVIRVREDFLCLLEADSTLGIRLSSPAFPPVKGESHEV